MNKIERKRAELELLEAEAAFVEKKQAGELTDDDRLELRALRQEFREKYRQPTQDGASPASIASKAKAKENG